MLKLPGHGRYLHSSIEKRPLYDWPSGKRLAFYIGLNIEHFAFMAGIGNDPFNRTSGPQTQRNYAWRDYGLRVGVWRVFDMLDELLKRHFAIVAGEAKAQVGDRERNDGSDENDRDAPPASAPRSRSERCQVRDRKGE